MPLVIVIKILSEHIATRFAKKASYDKCRKNDFKRSSIKKSFQMKAEKKIIASDSLEASMATELSGGLRW